MSIIIRGMEMPPKGIQRTLVITSHEALETSTREWRGYIKHEIIPVSDHGGLIDREKMLDAIRLELAQAKACEDMEDYESWVHTFHFVRKFPIIIEEDPPKEET